MYIHEAVRKSLETKMMFTRNNELKHYINFIPTNDDTKLITLVDLKGRRLPGKGWQPTANDLIADDWFITENSYQNLIAEI